MRLNRVLVAASLFAVTSAASLAAAPVQKDFFFRCTPGAVHACASVSVITNWTGLVNQVSIRVRNLQGGVFDNTGGSLIARIGLTAPAIVGQAGLNVHVVPLSGATTVGSPGAQWVFKTPALLGGPLVLAAGVTNTGNGAIQGCNAPAGGSRPSYFQTCNTGWVELTFTTTNNWSAASSEIAFLASDWAVGGGTECDTDNVPSAGRSQCVVATPEPVTMILLGSGLASMGGFGLVRRRKGTDVSTD